VVCWSIKRAGSIIPIRDSLLECRGKAGLFPDVLGIAFKVLEQLQKSTAEVKRLSGLLPMCASCKKSAMIREYWEQLKYTSATILMRISRMGFARLREEVYPEFADRLLEGQTPTES